MPKVNLRKVVSFVVSAAAVYFLVTRIVDNWDQIKAIDIQLTPLGLVPLLLFVVAVPLSGIFWGEILSQIAGKQVDRKEAALVHIKSWLLKYVPGQVGSVLGKLLWGTEHGFSKSKVGLSFFYENVLHALSSFTLSLPVIFLLLPDTSNTYVFLIPLVIIGQLFMFSSSTFTRFLASIAAKVTGKAIEVQASSLLSGKAIAQMQAKYYVPRVINAVGFAIIATQYLSVSSAGEFAAIGATYVLAGILGILAFMVPSGLGVREAVIAVLLSNYFSQAEAISLALIGRVYATAADIVLLSIYAYFKKDYKGL